MPYMKFCICPTCGTHLDAMPQTDAPRIGADPKISALEKENKAFRKTLGTIQCEAADTIKDEEMMDKALNLISAIAIKALRGKADESELDENANKCRDCGVVEGAFHNPGCDIERCPFCGGQLVSCNCMNKHFNIDYDEDLSSDQLGKWNKLLKEKGLIPYGKENN